MYVNADFSRRLIVTPDAYHWVASPQPGVKRMMLERLGAEQGRATSIVRYATDSHFPPHTHPDGEEIFVLSGVFSEGNAHYPAGWYMRNPPGSSHRPSSAGGAVIFVKLRYMKASEQESVRIDTNDAAHWREFAGGAVCALYSDETERVALVRLDARVPLPYGRAAELFVLDGELRVDGQGYAAGSWLRMPEGDHAEIGAGGAGATVYIRTRGPAEAEAA
ncbi:cupin domain-containing protein [Cupriavidus consociatus]|uniref:cupin domain-containing protein n=1 Tax=Cupriavidus consociatus TaxID=2821357 RepID=UPI001AE1F222|nr:MULTISPECIES: cupin domain-containing protein [unclassified Cupriavidus]MBP0623676.1 cupin domain-containing protein [Cupriavidus sp. LEh25]MDK2660380.1 cupin domain-containing protein [Cupriavidus sp. LEh21]